MSWALARFATLPTPPLSPPPEGEGDARAGRGPWPCKRSFTGRPPFPSGEGGQGVGSARASGAQRAVPPSRREGGQGVGRLLALATLALFLTACHPDPRTPVYVYSPHGRDQLTLLEHAFERAHPEYDVRWLDMGSQEILDRLRFEQVNPQADVWFGGPTTIFDRGVADSVLQPYTPSWAGDVGPQGVGPDALYWPAYRTPAVIVYNSAAVPRDSAPQDWDEVLEPKWHQRVLIRDPVASGTMRAIWGLIIERSIRTTGDTAAGMAWLRRLDGQTKSYALNPAVLDEKLARQEGLVTLWDLPDVLISRGKGMPFDYVFPASGTVVIDDAIGLVRGARHAEAAKAYIDFIGSEAAQILTARAVFRLPARHGLPADSVPAWVAEVEREMKVADMDWPLLAREGTTWMRYWDQHVRGTGPR